MKHSAGPTCSTTNGGRRLQLDAALENLAYDINSSNQEKPPTFWENAMGMMLVERHQASFFGKLLESCRAVKGRDSSPRDEARRSLARWVKTAGHARPIMQRRGQSGAGFRGVLGKAKSLPEAKARAIADFFVKKDESHDLGLLVAEVQTVLTRQGLRFGANDKVEDEGYTTPPTPETSASPAPSTPAEEEQLEERVTCVECKLAEVRRSFSETERSLAAEIRGLRAALQEEQKSRTAENTRWRRQFSMMVDVQEAMEARLADVLRLAEEAFALKSTREEDMEEEKEVVVDEEGDFSMTE
ncbi:unnamed protein product, partial [Ascophyllum nodosum]